MQRCSPTVSFQYTTCWHKCSTTTSLVLLIMYMSNKLDFAAHPRFATSTMRGKYPDVDGSRVGLPYVENQRRFLLENSNRFGEVYQRMRLCLPRKSHVVTENSTCLQNGPAARTI